MKTRVLTTAIAFLLTASALRAQTWDGGGANDNFNTANNWNPNAVPANNGTANLIFGGIVRLTPIVNVNFDVNGVTFNNAAGAFDISPGVSTALTVRGGGITNNDADTQTFSTPVTFASGSSITATSGNLNFTGQMNINTNTVTVSGGFATSIDGIVGVGGFVKNGTGTLSISPVGNQNYGLTINAGTVNYPISANFVAPTAAISVAGGTFAPLSHLTVANGATLDVAGTGTFTFPASRTMSVQGASTATLANSLTTAVSSIYRVTGTSSTFTTAGLTVRDSGLVEVLSGGAFTTTGGSLLVGAGGTAGTMLVDGVTSIFTNSPFANASVGNGAGSTGALTFNNGAAGSFVNSTITIGLSGGNGTLTVRNGAQVTAGTFEVAQGVSSGTANVLVTGPGSRLTATFNVADFSIGATSGSIGTVTVADGGELDLDGPLTLNETGTLNINGGIITMALTEAFTNNGTLHFNSGRFALGDHLNIGGGISPLGTNITLQPGKEIVVPNSRTTTVGTAGVVVLDGGVLSTGTLVRSSGGTIDFRRGTLRITNSSGLTVGSSGPLGANVSLPAGSALELTAAGATLSVSNGASLAVDGGTLSTRLLTVNGTALINAGTASALDGGSVASGGQLYVARDLTLGGIFTNNNGGRIELANGTGRISGGATLVNAGLLTGSGTIATPVSNSATGRIRVDTGDTLIVTAGFLGNSGELNLQGGTLDFAGAVTNNAGAFIAGRGALYTGGLTNDGQMAFSGGTMDIHGDTTLTAGSRVVTSGAGTVTTFFDDVTHNGLEIFTGANASTVFFGAQSGAGPFTGTGTVYFIGDLRPGNSPASVSYGGDVAFGGASSLTLEIGGFVAGAEYDHLEIAGKLIADGDLVLALLDGFTPQAGDAFDLLDVGAFAGDFDRITAPALADGNAWDFSALKTTGTVTVVPEPGIGALLASALTLLGARRARVRGMRVPISPLRTS